jgi:hypothetical protein
LPPLDRASTRVSSCGPLRASSLRNGHHQFLPITQKLSISFSQAALGLFFSWARAQTRVLFKERGGGHSDDLVRDHLIDDHYPVHIAPSFRNLSLLRSTLLPRRPGIPRTPFYVGNDSFPMSVKAKQTE